MSNEGLVALLRRRRPTDPQRMSRALKYVKSLSLGIKTAQKPYIVWSLGPKALIYESLDSEGIAVPFGLTSFGFRIQEGDPREELTQRYMWRP